MAATTASGEGLPSWGDGAFPRGGASRIASVRAICRALSIKAAALGADATDDGDGARLTRGAVAGACGRADRGADAAPRDGVASTVTRRGSRTATCRSAGASHTCKRGAEGEAASPRGIGISQISARCSTSEAPSSHTSGPRCRAMPASDRSAITPCRAQRDVLDGEILLTPRPSRLRYAHKSGKDTPPPSHPFGWASRRGRLGVGWVQNTFGNSMTYAFSPIPTLTLPLKGRES